MKKNKNLIPISLTGESKESKLQFLSFWSNFIRDIPNITIKNDATILETIGEY